jgi:hypothetical protein
MRPLKILTWNTHGSYLYYLTQAPHEFHVLSAPTGTAAFRQVTGIAAPTHGSCPN